MAERRERSPSMASSSSIFFFFFFSFFLLWFSFPLRVNSQGSPAAAGDLAVLLQMKEDWGNPSSLSSWKRNTSHCTDWAGVVCSAGGDVVTKINLRSLGIKGKVPAVVCDLRNLSSLDLSDNWIGGEFPLSLYNCAQLRSLNLSDNLFVGEIPTGLDRLSGLEVLDLSSNNFSGDVPPAVAKIPRLRQLFLDNNLFNGTFPKGLGSLEELEYLSLAANPFVPSELPPEFGDLKKLKYLWVSNANLIGGVPVALGSLTELEFLQLSSNKLTGKIPSSIWGLPKLKNVYLYNNQLSGEIVGEGGIASPNLTEVDLSMNHFTGKIPPDFGRQSNLQILFLYKNQLSGRIPEDIGKIPAMRDLRLFENNLTGGIPPEMGKYSKLLNFEVWSNGLSGELPEGLCTGGALVALIVHENNFTGGLPESLGNCQPLQALRLSGNSFSGEVPPGIWSLKNLSTVIMTGNMFSGKLPGRLPPSLSRLEIENNRFSGEVPSSAPGMMVFKASNNFFFGEITPDLTGMTLLQELLLEGNRIFGKIPAGIKVLKSLTNLILRSNQLSGEIPREIGSLPVLTSLDLSENRLSGEIPKELGKLKLNFLNLSGNHLSGEIPAALQNQAYESSFLSNPGICSSTSFLNLPPCTANSGGGSGKLSKGFLALLLTLSILFLLVTLLLAFLLARDRRRRRKNQEDLAASWKLTSFQSLNFSESNILRGVAAGNVIGGGGSGEVYRVSLGNRAGEVVAVKKLRSSGKIDAKAEKEFAAEVKILGSIRHANIVKLLCCISGEDAKLLVYEFMENGSLDQWLHGGRTPAMGWPARLSAAVGAARGLCYMHDECSPAIVHRDVKSSNILLDSGFQPKVADFGLARILGTAGEQDAGGGGATAASSLVGSVGYMAPECAYSRKLNEKVDVYSFGVVLLELTTGRRAHDGDASGGCLAEREWRRFQEGGAVEEALDPRIREPRYLEEIAVVYQLGLICTGTLPSTRPTMRDVLQVLLRCEQKHGDMEKKQLQVHGGDGAPLLGNAAKTKSHRTKQLPGAGDEDDEDTVPV